MFPTQTMIVLKSGVECRFSNPGMSALALSHLASGIQKASPPQPAWKTRELPATQRTMPSRQTASPPSASSAISARQNQKAG